MVELQTPETMRSFCCTKDLTDKTKNEENVPSIEVYQELKCLN